MNVDFRSDFELPIYRIMAERTYVGTFSFRTRRENRIRSGKSVRFELFVQEYTTRDLLLVSCTLLVE
jgi:hypothetical protein